VPDTTTFGGDPIPTGPEGAWVPGSMMDYAESIDPKLVHTVADQAARDANFATLPAGHIVTCAPGKTVWMSLGGGLWHTVASDSGTVTTGFTLSSGWTGTCRARNRGGNVFAQAYLTYTGLDIVSNANGLIAAGAVSIFTVPAPFYPSVTAIALANFRSLPLMCTVDATTGLVSGFSGAPGVTWVAGNILNFTATWQVAA
jgi:hypothetical protein